MTTAIDGALQSALYSRTIVRALQRLAGCPVGAWGETAQARLDLRGAMPVGAPYTLDDLVAYALVVDHADRYRAHERLVIAGRRFP